MSSLEGCAISVDCYAEAGNVTITIRNDAAVPAAIREHFFDKYVTAGKSEGIGLGTYSAKQVTEAQHGIIAMTANDVDGTMLTVQLPTG